MKWTVVFPVLLFACSVHANPMGKEQCLQCHGPFDALIAKNIQEDADPKPVNPHKFIPHGKDGGLDKIWECTMCHVEHSLPPKRDPKRQRATVEACYSCHHQYNFQPCNSCHGKN